MTLKRINKKTVGFLALGVVLIILVVIARIDWLGYKAVDTAKSKCMMAYVNLKQAVLNLPADEDELFEFIEDVCPTKERKSNIPSGGIWIWQARFWQSEDGKWFWQNYKRQRANNLSLAQRLTDMAHLIEAKTASITREVIRGFSDKKSKSEFQLSF